MVGAREVQRGLTRSMLDLIKLASTTIAPRPSLARKAVKVLREQRKASERREVHRVEGLDVPPFMIFSVTSNCNLDCAGCYFKGLNAHSGRELSLSEVSRVLDEAEDLGISIVLISGGEPLTKPGLVDVLKAHERTLFVLFTNGTLLDEGTIRSIARSDNIVMVLSIEGFGDQTDGRRGIGTYDLVISLMGELDRSSVFFGCSVTVTSKNFSVVTSDSFVRGLVERGCRAFIYVEYVPVEPGTEALVLSPEMISELKRRTRALEKEHRSIFISFPGDEGRWGGCISSGLGFFHIGPSGEVQPCPFAPYSDRNVKEMSLKLALGSPLLSKLREMNPELDETNGGCALWRKREVLAALKNSSPVQESKVGPYRS